MKFWMQLANNMCFFFFCYKAKMMIASSSSDASSREGSPETVVLGKRTRKSSAKILDSDRKGFHAKE